MILNRKPSPHNIGRNLKQKDSLDVVLETQNKVLFCERSKKDFPLANTFPLVNIWSRLVAFSLLTTLSLVSLSFTTLASAQDISVWMHQNLIMQDAMNELAEAYMEENEGVNISFESFSYDSYLQSLQTALPSNNEADIMQLFGSWACSFESHLATVPEDMLTVEQAQEDFFESSIAGYICDDKLVGIPQESNIEFGAVLINRLHLSRAGLAKPDWPTWDAVRKSARALTQRQNDYVLRAGLHYTSMDQIGFSLLSLIKQQGGTYQLEDGTFTFDTEEARIALELLKTFVDDGTIDPVLFNGNQNWVGDCIYTESCAMGIIGQWVIGEYREYYPELSKELYYLPLPYLGDEQHVVTDSGWGMTVSENSEHQDVAWDFIEFVGLNLDNALRFNIVSNTIPALKVNITGDAQKQLYDLYPYFDTIIELLPYTSYIGYTTDRDLLLYEIIYPNVMAVLQDLQSIDDALAIIEREANESQ